MKIKVLTDDHSDPACKYKTEHGLSVYVEFGGLRYLIDTGQSAIFLENARAMQVDIGDVDFVIITHGHYDHINGLPHFFAVNGKALIIISPYALQQQFFSDREKQRRYIGKNFNLDSELEKRFIFSDENVRFPESLIILKVLVKNHTLPRANSRLFKIEEKHCMRPESDTPFTGEEWNFIPDDFDHEIVPCFYSADEIVVFTGCAHLGILNILELVKTQFPDKMIKAVIGGFHLVDSDDENKFETQEELDYIGENLVTGYPGTCFYTGHCTGIKAFTQLKSKLGKRIQFFYPGFSLDI